VEGGNEDGAFNRTLAHVHEDKKEKSWTHTSTVTQREGKREGQKCSSVHPPKGTRGRRRETHGIEDLRGVPEGEEKNPQETCPLKRGTGRGGCGQKKKSRTIPGGFYGKREARQLTCLGEKKGEKRVERKKAPRITRRRVEEKKTEVKEENAGKTAGSSCKATIGTKGRREEKNKK